MLLYVDHTCPGVAQNITYFVFLGLPVCIWIQVVSLYYFFTLNILQCNQDENNKI